MRITSLKINGITNPLGFSFDHIEVSCLVEETNAKKLSKASIEVSKCPDFSELLLKKEGPDLKLSGERLDLKLDPYVTYYYRITVIGDNGDMATSETAWFETAKMKEPWQAEWIGPQKEDSFHPLLRKYFTVKGIVKRARLYICGLGVYEAYLNGNKIGKEYLAPYIHDYTVEYQYQTYSLDSMITDTNQITVMLGNGWYKGYYGLDGRNNNFGDRFAAIAEIHLEYEDGSVEVIGTDNSWEYCGSDIEDSGIYLGEIYNRMLWNGKINPDKKVAILPLDKEKLIARYSLPVIVKEELKPLELIHTPAGETVLDMGQNFTGYIEFEADLKPGTKIILDVGEVLQQGNFYNENYRSAKSRFTYISCGGKETVRPHFTFFGFRYVRVTGWPGEVNPEAFTGKVVYSDLDRTGYIETSNPKINRLYLNSLWSLKSNFLDIPTDCPQRDERMGWTGDAQVFAPTASFHMDTRAFYYKFIRDLRNAQRTMHGGVPHFIPNIGSLSGACSVWGDIATILPETLYEYYHNDSDMSLEYSMMKDWVDYITGEDEKAGRKYLYHTGFHYGDWLALDGITKQSVKGGTDDYYIASVYYYHSTNLVVKMAERLGHTEDVKAYQELADKIKEAIFTEYFTPSGRLAVDTQAAYIIALKFGVYKDKERILEGFRERLRKDCYQIKCGFVGAPLLCLVLCENGMVDLAYHFLLKEEFPSWLYCVNLGATTIWERWNSLLADYTISGTGMNSFNHYAYGSVMEFVYKYIVGIRPLQPGFQKVLIAPEINMHFRWVKGSYTSVNGNYVCEWNIKEDGKVHVHIEIPFNTSAVVRLPRYEKEEFELTAGSYDFVYIPGQDFRRIYSEETLLQDIAGDPEAIQILKDTIPHAVWMVTGDDIENRIKKLKELRYMTYAGIDSEKAEQAIKKLLDLKRW
jgi:alpha-L-rhamnosidase